MGKIKFIVLLVLATTFLIGCSKEPIQEINDANVTVGAVMAEGVEEYVSEAAKKLISAMVAAMYEVKTRDGKFFKDFDVARKILSEAKTDAEALKRVLFVKKAEMQKQKGAEKATKELQEATIEQILKNAIKITYKSVLEDSEINIDKLFALYDLNVMNYFGLGGKYDTELKKKVFKKSQEYEDKLIVLKALRQAAFNKYYYFTQELDSSDDSYNVKRKGFEIRVTSIGATKPLSIQSGDSYFYFPPLSLSIGTKYNHDVTVLFLPMSEEQGLLIENNIKDSSVYFIFKITRISETENFVNGIKQMDVEKGRLVVWKRKLFETDDLRLIVANSETGEVYFAKTYP